MTTKKPIAVFVSDLHAGLRLPHAKVSPDMTTSDRLDDVIGIIQQVTQYVEDHQVPHAFVAGDLFDKRHPDAPTMIKTANALYELGCATKMGVGILPGNHDAHDRAGKVYSVDLFDALRTDVVYSLNDPAVNPLVLEGTKGDAIHLHAVPWVPDILFKERVAEIAATLGPDGRNVLVFHQTVTGATDNGHVAKDALPPKMFKPFDLAISGHIHHPQLIGDKVQYLGSPLHLRFSDAGDNERGFWVLHDDLSLEMVQTRFNRFVRWSFLSDEGYSATDAATDLISELWDEVKELELPPYLDVLIEADREDAEAAVAIINRTVDQSLVRSLRVNAIYNDDGASERVRHAATAPGGAATPLDLVRAFVDASEAKWPAGATAEDLLAAVREVI